MLNPKTAAKQWSRRFRATGNRKYGSIHEPYVKVFENGILANPIKSAYPERRETIKTPTARRWEFGRNYFFKGLVAVN